MRIRLTLTITRSAPKPQLERDIETGAAVIENAGQPKYVGFAIPGVDPSESGSRRSGAVRP